MTVRHRMAFRIGRWRTLALGAVVAGLLAPVPGAAEVERIEIAVREPIAGGEPFGLAGGYEKLAGTVHYSLDPEHAANRRIVDLDLAPRDEDGRVRFSADLYVLKPVRPERGNGALLLEVPNRGGKAIVRYFNRGAGRSFDPVRREDLGDGFLMRHGFTLVWVGWQPDVPDRAELLRLHPVRVTDPPLEGLVRADHVFSEDAKVFALGHRNHRAYPVADPDDPRNVLTVRSARLGPRTVIPRERWRFARVGEDGRVVDDPAAIYLSEGFVRGKIYEAVYVARDPVVVGLGLAAIRDLASYLKNDPASPSPVDRALAMGISQTGRFLRHFLYLGCNQDVAGRPAFDGILAHTAGAGRGSFNHRFGQPSRDAHPFSAFFYPTDVFPFTGAVVTDPVSGRRDGLLRTLTEAGAVPRIFFTNSGYEYWGRAASLIHTAVDGRSDQLPGPRVRIYHFASTQHFVDRFPPQPQATRHPANPANFFWALRGLLLAMDAWVAEDREPPPSRFPLVDQGTLVAPEELAFPAIPGVEVPRQPHVAYRMDYGPRFWSAGIVDRQPPAVGPPFPVLVSQVDADGNELGGLRLPEIAVPVATYTPWNRRAAEIGAGGELADFRGAFLPFPATPGERQAAGDPRASIAERYGSREEYLGRYTEAAVRLIRERYLLAEDLPEMIDDAARLWDLVHGGASPAE